MQLQKFIRNQNHEQKRRLAGVTRKRNVVNMARANSATFAASQKGYEIYL
jgi:hypothetical protein